MRPRDQSEIKIPLQLSSEPSSSTCPPESRWYQTTYMLKSFFVVLQYCSIDQGFSMCVHVYVCVYIFICTRSGTIKQEIATSLLAGALFSDLPSHKKPCRELSMTQGSLSVSPRDSDLIGLGWDLDTFLHPWQCAPRVAIH